MAEPNAEPEALYGWVHVRQADIAFRTYPGKLFFGVIGAFSEIQVQGSPE